MKHQKELLSRPWAERAPELPGQADWLVETDRFNHRGRQVLEVCFSYNRTSKASWNRDRQDFRLFLVKTAGEFIVQFRGGVRFCSLTEAMRRGDHWTAPRTCYPWIEPEDEARIARILGNRKTDNHQLDNLDRWMSAQVDRVAQARREASGYIPDEWVMQCPEELPEGLEDFIRRTVLPEDRTLVYERGNVQGTCFRCGRKVRGKALRFRQSQYVCCPDCGEEVLCVLDGGTSWKADYVANIAFLQKGKDGGTVFARLFHLRRDPAARFERLADWLEECARYAFREKQAAMWVHEAKEHNWIGRCLVYRLERWTRSRRFYVYDGPYYFMTAGAEEALRGTRLQYCRLDEYLACKSDKRELNPIRWLAEFTRYPVLEFLWKAGYRRVVNAKILGLLQNERSCLRWQRASVREAFPFPLRLLSLKPPQDWSIGDFQRVKDLLEIAPLTDQEVGLLLEHRVDLEILRAALPHMTVRQLLKYRRSQQKDAFALYGDYLRECEMLRLDLSDRAVKFPSNLIAAHERTAAMVEYEAHKEEIAAFARQTEKLTAWSWTRDGLLIRPAASLTELKVEGKALQHCVAGYGPDMAKGKTAIFLVRRADTPDEPFYTLELKDRRIVQCRTDHNVSAEANNPAVWRFVTDWLAQVVNAPAKRRKMQMEQRMEGHYVRSTADCRPA